MRRVSLWIGMWLALALLARGQSLPNLAEVKWEKARNADTTIARFETVAQDGAIALHVTQETPKGYSFYRTVTRLAPGDYTLKVNVGGKAEKSLLMQCYAFDASNKPRLIFYKPIPAADLAPQDLYVTFTVPDGSVSQRFDLGIAGNRGEAIYRAPVLFAGKVNARTAPKAAPQPAAQPAVSAAAVADALPPVNSENWKPARNVQAAARFEIVKENDVQVMHVTQTSQEGYSFYRAVTKLPAGDYTLKVNLRGKSEKGLLQSCYSFNQANKDRLLFFHQVPGGVTEPDELYITFTVPADSASLRFDLGIAGNRGEAFYWDPVILKGKVKAPPKKKQGFGAIPAANQWVAEWLWFENDPGVPAMDFTHSFTLDRIPATAICEITADNGYELILNGKSVGADVDWKSVEVYDLTPFLQKGKNSILIHARNTDGPAGVIFQAVMLDDTGKATVVVTDKNWTVTHPDGRPAPLKCFGDKGPWKIPFHKVNPPKTLSVKPVQATRTVAAGKLLSIEFPLPKELDVKPEVPFPGLDLKYTDAKTGEDIGLSGCPVFSRCVYGGRSKQLFVEQLISVFAQPGTYRVEVIGPDFVIHAGEITITPPATPIAKQPLKFPKPSLRNDITVGADRQSLYTFAPHVASRERFTSWSHIGGHLYELGVATGTWAKEMRYDMAAIEKRLLDILELDPQAAVILKFRIDVPGWWVAAHPDEVYRSKQGRSAQQSFCSDIWVNDSLQTVVNSMEWIAKRPCGAAVSGALIMGFRGGEFQLWGEDVGERDVSPAARKAFEQYQKARGISPLVSLDDPALDHPWKPGVSPAAARARDIFFRFVAERQADNLAVLSRGFKKHFGDRFIFGFYFGYGMEYAGSNTRMLLAGHLGVENLYDKGTFDLESCPISYGLRRLDRSHAFMYPVESARLHGILPIGENDVRNCLNPDYADGSGVSRHSMLATVQDNRRIRLFAAAHGALVRYLALHDTVNWYDHPALWRTIREDDREVRDLQANEIAADSQIAMAVNFLEFTRAWRFPDAQVGKFAGYSRDYLMRTGYGIDFVTLRDFIQQPLKWKRAYIPLPGLLTPAQKQALAAKYAPLPAIRENDGALLWKDGRWSILPATATPQDIWRAFAKPAALKAGFDTVWYQGGNFLHTWDGTTLK